MRQEVLRGAIEDDATRVQGYDPIAVRQKTGIVCGQELGLARRPQLVQ